MASPPRNQEEKLDQLLTDNAVMTYQLRTISENISEIKAEHKVSRREINEEIDKLKSRQSTIELLVERFIAELTGKMKVIGFGWGAMSGIIVGIVVNIVIKLLHF